VIHELGRVPEWLHAREVRNRALVDELGKQLDAGESEVNTLCIEISGAVAVLDEKKARRIAREKLEGERRGARWFSVQPAPMAHRAPEDRTNEP
jgi:hypothetical protein